MIRALVACVAACAAAVAGFAATRTDETIVVGVVATRADATDSDGYAFARGAALALDLAERRGNARLVVESCDGTTAGLDAAIARLATQGARVVLGPLEESLAAAAEPAAARAKLPLLAFQSTAQDVAAGLVNVVVTHWRATRIAYVSDGSKSSKDVRKAFENALPHPSAIVLDIAADVDVAGFAKKAAKAAPQVVVIDAAPAAAQALLRSTLKSTALACVLTPRAYGDASRQIERPVFVVLPRSPVVATLDGPFVEAWEKTQGPVRFGATEGFDAANLALAAIARAGDGPPAASGLALHGPRGEVTTDAKSGAVRVPLQIWRLARGKLEPWFPSALPAEWRGKGTAQLKTPDVTLGDLFGAWRTDRFAFEDGTQWVRFSWGDAERATIDDDLKQLGLSTGGACPLVDDLVKDELMARLVAVTNTKFLRNADGSAISGKSLKISFATLLPPKTKKKPWEAYVAGDNPDAGGMAHGDWCEIFSTFIRRTIFQEHALAPPLCEDDLPYLDGSYRFGGDRARDMRSELIRSLINGYAGSMALTSAHEVGHCGGLGHSTDDPAGIMNVEEGAGIDYPQAHFTETELEVLRKRFGVAAN